MADNVINVRIKDRIDTESNWSSKNPTPLKGERCITDGTGKYKIGDGEKSWLDLPHYEAMTASDRSKFDSIASGANKTTVDSVLSSTSTNPVQNKVVNSALSGKSNTNHTHDLSTMINTLSVGTATPNDDDYYVSQYTGGGTTITTYHRRPLKALFEYIKSKLHKVAVSGSYNDLSNKPTIPIVGNGTVTIKQGGSSKGTFTMNQSGNTTIELTDNNTTYSTGTASTAGLTKLYTGTGTATDGTMTQTSITTALNGKAASSHTHDDRYYTESEINTKLGDLSSLSSYGSDVTSILKAIIAKLPETYSGSYSVTPSATAQSLSTSGKVMKQNVSVSAIPYKEESNSSGTTVTIG